MLISNDHLGLSANLTEDNKSNKFKSKSQQNKGQSYKLSADSNFTSFGDGFTQSFVAEGTLLVMDDETKNVEFKPYKSLMRWPLLFLFINTIMIVSAVSLCLSPAST